MSWPTPQDYNEAIQSPLLCFADPELREGTVETTALGLPRAITGAFASVYKVQKGDKAWAVRCFLNNRTGQKSRYQRISEFVLFDDLECTVDFHYLDEGIKIRGTWYPCLKMLWIDGLTLDRYVEENYNKPESMAELLKQFRHLVGELERAGIAHGDLQHGNILVTAEGLRLVDYDALYVPALAGMKSLEVGHPNYQHPERTEHNFDCSVDNFSQWLIHVSLLTILIDPGLYRVLKGGDEHLLFKRTDIREPESSRVFQVLLNHPAEEISAMARLLIRMIWARPYAIPPLVATVEELESLPNVRSLAGDYDGGNGGGHGSGERGGHGSGRAGTGDGVGGTGSVDDVEGTGSDSRPEGDCDGDGGELPDGSLPSGGGTNRYDALFDEEELATYAGSRFISASTRSKNLDDRVRIAIARLHDAALWRFAKGTWCNNRLSDARHRFNDADYDAAIKLYLQVYTRLERDGENSDYLRSEYFEALIGLGSCFGMQRKATLAANYFLIAVNRAKNRATDAILRSMFLLALARLESGNKIAALKVFEEHFHHIDLLFTRTIGEEVERNVFALRPGAFAIIIEILLGMCVSEDKDRQLRAGSCLLETAVRIRKALSSVSKEPLELTDDNFRAFMKLGSRMHKQKDFRDAEVFFQNLADLCKACQVDEKHRLLCLLCCAVSANQAESLGTISSVLSELKKLDDRELFALIDAAIEYLPVTELVVSIVGTPVVDDPYGVDDEPGDEQGAGRNEEPAAGSAGGVRAKSSKKRGAFFSPQLACTYSYLEGGSCLEQIVDLLDPFSDEELIGCLKESFLSNAAADNGSLAKLMQLLVEQKRQRWLTILLPWLMDNQRTDMLARLTACLVANAQVSRMTASLASRHQFEIIDLLSDTFAERYKTPLMGHLMEHEKDAFLDSLDKQIAQHADMLDVLAVELAGRGVRAFDAGKILDRGVDVLELLELIIEQVEELGQSERIAVALRRMFGKTNARFVSRWLQKLASQSTTNEHSLSSAKFASAIERVARFGDSRVLEVVVTDMAGGYSHIAIVRAAKALMKHGHASHVVSLAHALALRGNNIDTFKAVRRELKRVGSEAACAKLQALLEKDGYSSEAWT